MALISDVMDVTLLEKMVSEKFVNVTKHPQDDLFILNYSARAQYEREWNEVTRQCRGLIVKDEWKSGKIIGRPFPKFHNVSEHETDAMAALPADRSFDVWTKVDGSLGIGYIAPDGLPAIATRGSFQSDQAQWATSLYRVKYGAQFWPDGITPLWEIIYPQNRIVVNYGDFADLVLLAAVHTETGADMDISVLSWTGTAVERFNGVKNLQELLALAAESPNEYENQEGFVIRFAPEFPGQPSLRAKCKLAEYVRLHRIVTGVSSKTIWEYLKNKQSFAELLDRVPDEFYVWVKTTAKALQQRYDDIEHECVKTFASRPTDVGRREIAAFFEPHEHRAILFRMLDGKDYEGLIWKELRPAYERPFVMDEG